MLIEVLSPTNRRETWEAVWTYTTIPSVQEIMVLDSLKVSGASIGFSCPIEQIYERTHLAKR